MLETYALIKPNSKVFVEGHVISSTVSGNNASSYIIAFEDNGVLCEQLKFKKEAVYELYEIVKMIPNDMLIEEIKRRKLKY